MNVVIMAGGGGTRLWPLSRKATPKQFMTFDGKKTLLEHTYERAQSMASPANIFVATLQEYGQKVQQLLPAVLAANIFYEPSRRDTTAAFASVVIRLKVRGFIDEPTIFMWSDHVFTEEAEFRGDLKKIPKLLTQYPDTIVMAGHIPVFPETGLGYIEAREPVEGYSDVHWVKSFKEKPDKPTAEKFLAAGNYFWNIGCFSFLPRYFLAELAQYEPSLTAQLTSFEQAVQENNEAKAIELYGQLPKISIEYTLIEKTPRVLVVTGDYGWSDVGNWAAVHDVFGLKGDHVPHGHHVHVDSDNNYVYNTTPKVVSLIGVKNSIVVVTEDAVLITNKKDAHRVKEVVARLEAEGKEKFL